MNQRLTLLLGSIAIGLAAVSGCGTTKSRMATEQLLMSDAVDRTIAKISFHPLEGKRVYFDHQYIQNAKGLGFVNSDYVISGMRQQIAAAGCLLQEKAEDAEYVIEARIGALGTDGHDVVYGLPANTALADAANLLPAGPPVPSLPELALAKKQDLRGAAKIGVFAYHRQTREPIWQSGVAISTSNAKDTWLFGVGPFQFGSIYDGAQFAGSRIHIPLVDSERQPYRGRLASYFEEFNFADAKAEHDAQEQSLEELRTLGKIVDLPELHPLGLEAIGDPSASDRRERISEVPIEMRSMPSITQ